MSTLEKATYLISSVLSVGFFIISVLLFFSTLFDFTNSQDGMIFALLGIALVSGTPARKIKLSVLKRIPSKTAVHEEAIEQMESEPELEVARFTFLYFALSLVSGVIGLFILSRFF